MNKYKILRELSAVPGNFLSTCYSVTLSSNGANFLQMKYNTDLAAHLKIDLETEGKVDKNGFVCFCVKFKETDWKIIMT